MAAEQQAALTKKQNLLQSVKFLLVSVSAGGIQAVSFWLLGYIPFTEKYWIKYLISLILSVLFSFTVNRRYTFQSAANVPKAMLQLALYYAVFTPVSTYLGNYFAEETVLAATAWGDYLVQGVVMLSNFITEFLFSRFVMYRGKINTNELGQKENLKYQEK